MALSTVSTSRAPMAAGSWKAAMTDCAFTELWSSQSWLVPVPVCLQLAADQIQLAAACIQLAAGGADPLVCSRPPGRFFVLFSGISSHHKKANEGVGRRPGVCPTGQ